MRISREREQLAKMQFGQRTDEISRKYANEGRRIEWMPRGGHKRAAQDRAHIAKLTELCNAWIDVYLIAFVKEGLVPDANDLREMEATIDQILSNRLGNDFYRPLASSTEAINMLPTRVKHGLRIKVKEMELEAKARDTAPRPPASTTYNTTIHGDNYGNIQQGGEGNTQTINRTDDET